MNTKVSKCLGNRVLRTEVVHALLKYLQWWTDCDYRIVHLLSKWSKKMSMEVFRGIGALNYCPTIFRSEDFLFFESQYVISYKWYQVMQYYIIQRLTILCNDAWYSNGTFLLNLITKTTYKSSLLNNCHVPVLS